jgi:hypothetical protein
MAIVDSPYWSALCALLPRRDAGESSPGVLCMFVRRLPHVLARAMPIAAALAGLTACAPGRDQFAPACPQASLLPEATDLTRYRALTNGSGHDLTDLVLQASVSAVNGKCQLGGNDHTLDASVRVTIELTRGPAATSRAAEVSYFVAVAEGDQILDKKVMSNRVEFPPNLDRIWLTSDPVDMQLPINSDKTGAAYTIFAGLQYTPAEWTQRTANGAE